MIACGLDDKPGHGRLGRIGAIVPANNRVIEPEFWSVLPTASPFTQPESKQSVISRRKQSFAWNSTSTARSSGVHCAAWHVMRRSRA
jgi:hypothetical protein